SHMARRDTVVRNFLDVGGSSTTVIDLSEILFSEMEFPDMEISDNPIQLDTVSSNNESIISLYEEEYNFITKTQSKKGKNLENNDENNEAGLNENLSEKKEDLDDNEINFNAPDSYEENDNSTEPADTTNAST
ncbi:18267_t:CDS:2, partial [Gigaspora rosea]